MAHCVRARYCGSTLRTAGGLRHAGPRPRGFQNSGSSRPADHERPTKQTQPLLPLFATTIPLGVSTRISASAEIDGGAAVRAKTISAAALGIKYFASGA